MADLTELAELSNVKDKLPRNFVELFDKTLWYQININQTPAASREELFHLHNQLLREIDDLIFEFEKRARSILCNSRVISWETKLHASIKFIIQKVRADTNEMVQQKIYVWAKAGNLVVSDYSNVEILFAVKKRLPDDDQPDPLFRDKISDETENVLRHRRTGFLIKCTMIDIPLFVYPAIYRLDPTGELSPIASLRYQTITYLPKVVAYLIYIRDLFKKLCYEPEFEMHYEEIGTSETR